MFDIAEVGNPEHNGYDDIGRAGGGREFEFYDEFA